MTRLSSAHSTYAVLAALWVSVATAQTTAEPIPPDAPGDSTSANLFPPSADGRGEAGARNEEVGNDPSLDALSISDAEVDSLIRAYQEPEERHDPAAAFGLEGWRAQAELGAARYNRVEGLNIMSELTLSAPTLRTAQAFARVGYGWAAKEPTWQAGIRLDLLPRRGAPLFEVSHFREVYAYGSSGPPGNTFTALLLGKDYGDYLSARGVDAGVTVTPGSFRVRLSYRHERQESLRKQTDFTLFSPDNSFRANPPVDDLRVGLVALDMQWRDLHSSPFSTSVHGIAARTNLGGDLDYETLRVEVAGRRGLWFGDEVVGRVGAGTVSGDVPRQAVHNLGGFAVLRGYDINEIPARRFAHFRLDYEVGSNPLGIVPFARSLRLQPIPFGDAAVIFATQTPDGAHMKLSPAAWRFSAGLGLQARALRIRGSTGLLRFDIARRLDRDDDNMTYRVLIAVEATDRE